jgi:phosphoesterase RecJ-like protein
MTRGSAQEVSEALARYDSCLIATHISPEGDAIGTMLALALALEARGVRVQCYDRDGVPDNCRFMPTWERVSRELPALIPPLVIYVDAERIERCGLTLEQVAGAECLVRIDHHTSTVEDPGPAWVDTTAAATGELMYRLLRHMDAEITPGMATCLQGAMMVDTGRFSFSNTTPNTHRVAADLLAAGADVATIVEWTWGRVPLAAAQLLGRALAGLQTAAGGKLVWAVLRREDYDATGARGQDTEGIIDHVRTVQGAEIAILFSDRNGQARLSLRSHGDVDVAALARRFGGGGHVKAAGITYDGSIDEAVKHVIPAAREALGDR